MWVCECVQWWRVRLGVQWETRIEGKVHGKVPVLWRWSLEF